ncbi:MAG: hypothetical protein WKF30_19540 [Pyrinomonadaceae bacterium]
MRFTTNISFHRWRLLIFCPLLLAGSLSLFPEALAQAKKPITKQGLLKALKLNALSTKELIEQIETRGGEFQLSAGDEAELKAAGARPEILTAARSSFRTPETAPPSSTIAVNAPRGNASTSQPTANVPPGGPLSKSEIITLLQSGVPTARVEQFVEVRGISFVSTPEIAREVMAAGGNRALVGALSEKSASGAPNSSENLFAGNNATPNRGPDYDDLTDKATDAIQAENTNGAIQLLQQAIQVDASKPTAYALLGVAQLYGRRNLGAAVSPMRSAIERGRLSRLPRPRRRFYHALPGIFLCHQSRRQLQSGRRQRHFRVRRREHQRSQTQRLYGSRPRRFPCEADQGSWRAQLQLRSGNAAKERVAINHHFDSGLLSGEPK